jgi:tetratricopeptide (TPR) repeat protein
MAKIGRNAPCPCGSGKKYKTCCLAAAEAARVSELLERRRAASAQGDTAIRAWLSGAARLAVSEDAGDGLDELSNSVVERIREGRLDEALTLCERLLREYPDVVDGLERSAMVHEARGDYALAAHFYRRALDFTELPEQRDGFEEEGRDYYRDKIATMQRLAAPAGAGNEDLPPTRSTTE